MAKQTAWQSQTKWLSDTKFESSRKDDGIWNDRVPKSARRCQVTDAELERRRKADKHTEAVAAVDKVMRLMGARANSITPRTKWLAVDLLIAGRKAEAFAVLVI